VRFGEHPLEQGGFASAEKTGEDGGGNESHVSDLPVNG
jgi:hypothetical protein